MKPYYTSLGAAPLFASDPVLARTAPAARALLRSVKRLPRSRQMAALHRAIARLDPDLPARLQRTARHLKRQGMSTSAAVERALALSLADGTINQLQQIGREYRRGRLRPASIAGLGNTSTSSTQSPEEVVGRMFQGVLCSEGLQQQLADLAGRNEGREAASATSAGFDVAQGFAQCQSLVPGATPAPAAPQPAESERNTWLFPTLVAVGSVAVLGATIYFVRKG
jgi:hypothetical protein